MLPKHMLYGYGAAMPHSGGGHSAAPHYGSGPHQSGSGPHQSGSGMHQSPRGAGAGPHREQQPSPGHGHGPGPTAQASLDDLLRNADTATAGGRTAGGRTRGAGGRGGCSDITTGPPPRSRHSWDAREVGTGVYCGATSSTP
jgi:hypothetical protein